MPNVKSLIFGASLLVWATAVSAQDQRVITIGTGGVTGVYYPTGGAICRLVNEDRKEHGMRCSVKSTGGSVYNIRTFRGGELDFGFATSDVQKDALEGLGTFEADGSYDGLRSVFSLYAEPNHIMVRADAGISSIPDMKGKKVSVGDPGGASRVIALKLLEANGLSKDDLDIAMEFKSSEQAAALCDGKVDAAFWNAGMPNGSTMEATSTCDIEIIDLANSNMNEILASNSAYVPAVIPGGMYRGNDEDITTWGPKATLLVDASTHDDVVYGLVRAVFENFADFKRLHPAFAPLNEKEMTDDALSAPLHPGAVKYYKERGWM